MPSIFQKIAAAWRDAVDERTPGHPDAPKFERKHLHRCTVTEGAEYVCPECGYRMIAWEECHYYDPTGVVYCSSPCASDHIARSTT